MNIIDHMRVWIYDRAVVSMTASWYRAVLGRMPLGCRVLDIGVGTGSALLANADILIGKGIHVTGVDVDAAYIGHCKLEVAYRGLAERINVRLESVYDHKGGPYDAAYFSASFMLLPDPLAALQHIRSLLLPEARLYFTQTFEHKSSRFVESTKPLLRLLTTIDFGRVTYERDFRKTLVAGGILLERLEVLHAGKRRSAILATARA